MHCPEHSKNFEINQSTIMLIVIDNYDSFTYNIVQYFRELGADVTVLRNNETNIASLSMMNPEYIVISPGPCTPNEAGISMDIIRHFYKKIPLLGVCLGHQCIGQVFDGRIIRAKKVMHGKTSAIYHNGQGVFAGIKNPFIATRYHSLVVEKETLPDCLEMTAWTYNEDNEIDEIMGLRHRSTHIEGVQFHPESILTEHGHSLFANFMRL